MILILFCFVKQLFSGIQFLWKLLMFDYFQRFFQNESWEFIHQLGTLLNINCLKMLRQQMSVLQIKL